MLVCASSTTHVVGLVSVASDPHRFVRTAIRPGNVYRLHMQSRVDGPLRVRSQVRAQASRWTRLAMPIGRPSRSLQSYRYVDRHLPFAPFQSYRCIDRDLLPLVSQRYRCIDRDLSRCFFPKVSMHRSRSISLFFPKGIDASIEIYSDVFPKGIDGCSTLDRRLWQKHRRR